VHLPCDIITIQEWSANILEQIPEPLALQIVTYHEMCCCIAINRLFLLASLYIYVVTGLTLDKGLNKEQHVVLVYCTYMIHISSWFFSLNA